MSVAAQIRNLVGDEERMTVEEALGRCGRGEVMGAREGGREVAVFVMEDGSAFVVDDRCPHDGGRISDGFVEGGRLVCARHGWEFDPATGRCPHRPRLAIEVVPLRRH